ncbi:MAG TPA: DUF3185 domain-containing protein [Terriglobia bacterium]|nr:DUF3185 domain-containing protein [Terriglobia bacterium]
MKPTGIIGIILIIAGVIVLIYGAITYTTHKTLFKAGPVQATAKTHKTVPLPPVLGVVLLAGGIVLVVVGGKRA